MHVTRADIHYQIILRRKIVTSTSALSARHTDYLATKVSILIAIAVSAIGTLVPGIIRASLAVKMAL